MIPGMPEVASDIALISTDGANIVAALARALGRLAREAKHTSPEYSAGLLLHSYLYGVAVREAETVLLSGESLADDEMAHNRLDSARELLSECLLAAQGLSDNNSAARLRQKMSWIADTQRAGALKAGVERERHVLAEDAPSLISAQHVELAGTVTPASSRAAHQAQHIPLPKTVTETGPSVPTAGRAGQRADDHRKNVDAAMDDFYGGYYENEEEEEAAADAYWAKHLRFHKEVFPSTVEGRFLASFGLAAECMHQLDPGDMNPLFEVEDVPDIVLAGSGFSEENLHVSVAADTLASPPVWQILLTRYELEDTVWSECEVEKLIVCGTAVHRMEAAANITSGLISVAGKRSGQDRRILLEAAATWAAMVCDFDKSVSTLLTLQEEFPDSDVPSNWSALIDRIENHPLATQEQYDRLTRSWTKDESAESE